MQINDIPFNQSLDLRSAPSEHDLLELPFGAHLLNHLGTIHAAAIFALAEASSGEALLRIGDEGSKIGGIVRKAQCKYSSPASSTIRSKLQNDPGDILAAIATTERRGKALVTIEIGVFSKENEDIGRFSFDWFLTKLATPSGLQALR